MYISLADLALIVLFILAVGIGIYLIAVLRRVLNVLGHVNSIIQARESDINLVIAGLPTLVDNLNKVTVNLQDTLEQTNEVISAVQMEVIDKVNYLEEGLDNFATYFGVVIEMFRTFFNWRAK